MNRGGRRPAAGVGGAWVLATLLAACSIPGIAPEGRQLGLGGEIAAGRDVVRTRADDWLARNGYRQVAGGSTLVAEKRAPSDRAGVNELVVVTVQLEARGADMTYAQIMSTPYLENGGRRRVERETLRRIQVAADVYALWDAMAPRPRNPPRGRR